MSGKRKEEMFRKIMADESRTGARYFNVIVTEIGKVFAVTQGGLGASEAVELEDQDSRVIKELLAAGDLVIDRGPPMTAPLLKFEDHGGVRRGIETNELVSGVRLKTARRAGQY